MREEKFYGGGKRVCVWMRGGRNNERGLSRSG